MDPWSLAMVNLTPLITPRATGILPDLETKNYVTKREKLAWNEKHPFNLVWEGKPENHGWNRVRVWIGGTECLSDPRALWDNGIA